MIGNYCRQYRLINGYKLKDLTVKVKALSAFENGRSTNMEHLALYIKLSHKLDDTYYFMKGLTLEVLNNGE